MASRTHFTDKRRVTQNGALLLWWIAVLLPWTPPAAAGADANSPPVAAADVLLVEQSHYQLLDVLANDTDSDGDVLTIAQFTPPKGGSLSTVDGRWLIYTLWPNFSGTDTFSYTISDGSGGTSTATVTLQRTGPRLEGKRMHTPSYGVPTVIYDLAEDAPEAERDAFTIQRAWVLGWNDAPLTAAVEVKDNRILYTNAGATPGYGARLSWRHASGIAGITDVWFSNRRPETGSVLMVGPVWPATVDVTPYGTDEDGDELVLESATQGTCGTVSISGNELSYTPGETFEGRDTFTYTVTDRCGGRGTATVSVSATTLERRVLAGRGQSFRFQRTWVDPHTEARWLNLGLPSLIRDGLGWRGRARTAAGDFFIGIFSGDPAAPALRLRAGDAAPTVSFAVLDPSTRFKTFGEPVFGRQSFAVAATLAGPRVSPEADTGVWFDGPCGITAAAVEGDRALGTNGVFDAFLSVAMTEHSHVYFVARIRSDGNSPVSAGNNLGLWFCDWYRGFHLLLRSGSDISMGQRLSAKVRDFQTLTMAPGSAGEARYGYDVAVRIRFVDGTSAVGTVGPEGLHLREWTGAGAGAVRAFGIPDPIGTGDELVTLATVADPILGDPKRVVQSVVHTGMDVALAQVGAVAPGTDEALFRSFMTPAGGVQAGGGEVAAFIATVTGATPMNEGVWVWRDGELSLLARKGQEAPEANGARFQRFLSVAILPNYGPMFVATVVPPKSEPRRPARGLWATDSGGALRLIAKEGDSVPIGERLKILRKLEVLGAVSGSPAQARAYGDDPGRIAYRATFDDGSTAVVRATVP